jgi:hypothetical protein
MDDLILYLDAADYASWPGGRSLAGAFGDYGSNQVHYDVVGDDGVILLGTSTSYVGRFASTIASSGDHTVMFDYWSDNDSVNFYIDNDGVDNNEFNTTITANKKKASYSQTQNMSTTGSSTMYLKTTSTGSKVYISNFRFFRNGTAWNDLSGKGYDGTLVHSPTFSSANGGSFAFDGANDYVNLGTQINGDIAQHKDCSFCFWFKVDAINADQAIIASEIVGGTRPILIWLDVAAVATSNTGGGDVGGETTKVITVMVSDSGAEFRYTTTNNIISADTWYNLCAVLEPSDDKFYTYLNGTQVALFNSATCDGIKTFSDDFIIGSTDSSSIDGNMASVRVYSKALTAAQVKQNFNAERNRFGV